MERKRYSLGKGALAVFKELAWTPIDLLASLQKRGFEAAFLPTIVGYVAGHLADDLFVPEHTFLLVNAGALIVSLPIFAATLLVGKIEGSAIRHKARVRNS